MAKSSSALPATSSQKKSALPLGESPQKAANVTAACPVSRGNYAMLVELAFVPDRADSKSLREVFASLGQ